MKYIMQDGPCNSVNILRIDTDTASEICTVWPRPACNISGRDLAGVLVDELNLKYEHGKKNP